eukprot:TRINITY_DN14123_c0_g1_i1.p1 TRINITY_DN14123_c0_g1~~TRINITY_DN14123_c0_g1_i1.p1  ORF type:complete len:1043 (+),score=182.11 TRINITY_DN14123_c0_g1_i1:135-3263(+)
MDGAENITVLVRVRPSLKSEAGTSECVVCEPDGRTVTTRKGSQVHSLYFDRVIDSSTPQATVFESAKCPVEAVLKGFNATIFAYGQTGTGKTYTMMGLDASSVSFDPVHMGIIPRSMQHIFEHLESNQGLKYSCTCSYLELYNEKIFDLLSYEPNSKGLDIREDRSPGGYGTFVPDATHCIVRCIGDVLKLMLAGAENRTTGRTNMNEHSSRSHTVFSLVVNQTSEDEEGVQVIKRGKLNLVDLAGSEKWSAHNGLVDQRIKEMASINQSLSVLGNCVAALSDDRAHVPFRDSKLTRLLQDSLGGNCKTTFITTISPSVLSYDETCSTLKFADRAKHVVVHTQVNEVHNDDKAVIRRLLEDNRRLRNENQRLLQRQTNLRAKPSKASRSMGDMRVEGGLGSPMANKSLFSPTDQHNIRRPGQLSVDDIIFIRGYQAGSANAPFFNLRSVHSVTMQAADTLRQRNNGANECWSPELSPVSQPQIREKPSHSLPPSLPRPGTAEQTGRARNFRGKDSESVPPPSRIARPSSRPTSRASSPLSGRHSKPQGPRRFSKDTGELLTPKSKARAPARRYSKDTGELVSPRSKPRQKNTTEPGLPKNIRRRQSRDTGELLSPRGARRRSTLDESSALALPRASRTSRASSRSSSRASSPTRRQGNCIEEEIFGPSKGRVTSFRESCEHGDFLDLDADDYPSTGDEAEFSLDQEIPLHPDLLRAIVPDQRGIRRSSSMDDIHSMRAIRAIDEVASDQLDTLDDMLAMRFRALDQAKGDEVMSMEAQLAILAASDDAERVEEQKLETLEFKRRCSVQELQVSELSSRVNGLVLELGDARAEIEHGKDAACELIEIEREENAKMAGQCHKQAKEISALRNTVADLQTALADEARCQQNIQEERVVRMEAEVALLRDTVHTQKEKSPNGCLDTQLKQVLEGGLLEQLLRENQAASDQTMLRSVEKLHTYVARLEGTVLGIEDDLREAIYEDYETDSSADEINLDVELNTPCTPIGPGLDPGVPVIDSPASIDSAENERHGLSLIHISEPTRPY